MIRMIKDVTKTGWFLVGLLLAVAVFYVLPMHLESKTGSFDFQQQVTDRLVQMAQEDNETIIKLEWQIAFYEHILSLDAETSKEKARDARVAFNNMIGSKIEEEEN